MGIIIPGPAIGIIPPRIISPALSAIIIPCIGKDPLSGRSIIPGPADIASRRWHGGGGSASGGQSLGIGPRLSPTIPIPGVRGTMPSMGSSGCEAFRGVSKCGAVEEMAGLSGSGGRLSPGVCGEMERRTHGTE